MDKKRLNEEIVRCRATVRKARVHAVRKLLKKISILRSCKNEALREKKLKKAKRLTAEIHVIKTLKLDHVTKFALVNEDYSRVASNTKQRRKRNACAQLAKTKPVAQKVEEIRSKFADWRNELPYMLRAEAKTKTEDKGPADAATTADVVRETKIRPAADTSRADVDDDTEESGERNVAAEKKPAQNARKPKKSVAVDKNGESVGEKKKKRARKKKKVVEADYDDDEEDVVEEEKVEDPFFIGKKVTAPKLQAVKQSEEKPEKKAKTEEEEEEENQPPVKVAKKKQQKTSADPAELHPSWKAKKIQMIRPFEGKKIVFE